MLTCGAVTGSIKPYPGNPRDNDAGVDAVAASLQGFGFRQPIVVDEDNAIVVGHTRYKAAIKLSMAELESLIKQQGQPGTQGRTW